MSIDQNDSLDTICFSGGLTLDHWHDVDRCSHSRRSRLVLYSYLIVAAVSNFAATVVAYQRADLLLTSLTAVAGVLISGYVMWLLKHEHKDRMHERLAAEHRLGWFAPTDWVVTESDISYSTEMENGTHTGVIPWSCVKETITGKSVLILNLSHPYTSAVIARDWVSDQLDWDRLRELANTSAAQGAR